MGKSGTRTRGRRRVAAATTREPQEAGRILAIVEELNAIHDAQRLVDRLSEAAADVAGFRVALISLTMPDGSLVGSHNLPDEDRARFQSRAAKTDIAYRDDKRRRIRAFAFPGTGIALVPSNADLPRASLSAGYRDLERTEGTWRDDDRLFVIVTGAAGREIGVLSLDFPLDGARPTEESLGPLRVAERLLAIGGSLLHSRVLEQGLRRNEEDLRALVDDAPVGIYRRGPGRRLLSANLRLASILGYASPEALLEDSDGLARIEPPVEADRIDALGEGDDLAATEVTGLRRDGGPIRLRIAAHRARGRDHVLGIVEDVTQESVLAEHLQRARRMEAVGTLASGIAHDFNNLLCGILGYAALLRERAGGDPSLDGPARSVEQAARRGADLARRLLGIATDAPGDRASVDVGAVVEDCARIARETFDRRVTVETSIDPGLPRTPGNASDIAQAVLNLCINARDSMPRGGRLRLGATLDESGPPPAAILGPAGAETADPTGPWVRIEVADEGEGMDAATRARAFEPFFTTKERGKGTGLGLYMVYTTVQAHGGALNLSSERGEGTKVRVYLRAGGDTGHRAGGGEPRHGTPAPAAPPVPGACRGARVLIVEDEEMLRDLASTVLADAGHVVETAADGLAGAERAERPDGAFDVVVLDLVMPRLSGAQAFRRIRAARPDVPVVLTSGNVEEGLLDMELRRGVACVLPKPWRPADLVAAVAKALATRPVGR